MNFSDQNWAELYLVKNVCQKQKLTCLLGHPLKLGDEVLSLEVVQDSCDTAKHLKNPPQLILVKLSA